MTLCIPTLKRSHLGWLALSALAACGGAGLRSEEPKAPAASAEIEPPPSTRATQSSVQQAPALTTVERQGSMVVTAHVDGQPAAAHVQVLDVPHAPELQGMSGESIVLPAGNQRIAVSIDDTNALLDKPTQKLTVFVQPDKPTPVDVVFPWARVRLDVVVQGRSQAGVPVKLMRGDKWVAELKSGAAPKAISPGKYEADVLLHGRTVHVAGLVFLDGAEQTVPVRVHP